MGCGKSKHDVASDNTVLQRKKSSVNSKAGQENGAETKDQNNNSVDNVSPKVEVEHTESECVKDFGVESNDVKVEAEKTNVQEEKKSDGAEGPSEKSEAGEDDSMKENDEKVNDTDTADTAEEKKAENEKKDVTVEKETLAKEEEAIKDTNVSTSEGEEKDLKAEEGHSRIQQAPKIVNTK